MCCVFYLQFFNYMLCCMCCVRLSYWIKITYILTYLYFIVCCYWGALCLKKLNIMTGLQLQLLCWTAGLTRTCIVTAGLCTSYLFWSDGAGINAKIERSDLSGNSRTVLVSSTQGLVSPTTLVVDFSSQKLYWLDSAAEKIGHVNFDGSEPFTQTLSLSSQVSAMTVYRVRIFRTDE